MKLHVITGTAGSGKTTKLQAFDPRSEVIIGSGCSNASLLRRVRTLFDRGAACVLVDDCSVVQLAYLHGFTLGASYSPQFSESTIYAVSDV